MRIKISVKSLKHKFHPCDLDFIKNVCHASCCESKTYKNGALIAIHPNEQEKIIKLGGVIINNLLDTSKDKKCPFRTKDFLCSLHPDNKPIGCITSPFELTKNNILKIQRRYYSLKCYLVKEGKTESYKSHRWSLEKLFGKQTVKRIIYNIENKNDEYIFVEMDYKIYKIIKENKLFRKKNILKYKNKKIL